MLLSRYQNYSDLKIQITTGDLVSNQKYKEAARDSSTQNEDPSFGDSTRFLQRFFEFLFLLRVCCIHGFPVNLVGQLIILLIPIFVL